MVSHGRLWGYRLPPRHSRYDMDGFGDIDKKGSTFMVSHGRLWGYRLTPRHSRCHMDLWGATRQRLKILSVTWTALGMPNNGATLCMSHGRHSVSAVSLSIWGSALGAPGVHPKSAKNRTGSPSTSSRIPPKSKWGLKFFGEFNRVC